MSIDALRANIGALIEAIDVAVDQKRVLPALMLIYAGIDVAGSLERRSNEGTRASFVRWVDQYLIPAGSLSCTALELYGARCGILHSFSANSDLYRDGRVRRVVYAWGDAKVVDAESAIRRLERTDCVAIHLTDLRDAFQAGLLAYFEAIAADELRLQTAVVNAGEWLVHVDQGVVQEFLKHTSEQADA
jgi:hypothetical protein